MKNTKSHPFGQPEIGAQSAELSAFDPAQMTWAEIAVFVHLMGRANRRNGRIGLCEGLTGNRLAKDIRKSRSAIHRALNGLSSTKGPHGYRDRLIELTPAGILVIHFAALDRNWVHFGG